MTSYLIGLFLFLVTQTRGRVLGTDTLLYGTSVVSAVDNREFLPQSIANTCDVTSDARSCWSAVGPPRVNFDGVLTMSDFSNPSRHVFNLIRVNPNPADAYPQPFDTPDSPRRYLAPFSYKYYQLKNDLVPELKGFILNSRHPYWEYILSPSKCWTELGDGLYDRCALVFAVTETQQNCVYNGLATFLVHSRSYQTSQVWYQITNNYCGYYQWDNFGFADVSYVPVQMTPLEKLKKLDIFAQFSAQQASWMTVKSITQLTQDVSNNTGNPLQTPYNLTSNPFNYYPDHADCSPSVPYVYSLGMYGVIYNNAIYGGISATRTGPHPYAQYAVYPQYSMMKSNTISMVVGSLIRQYGCTFPSTLSSRILGTSCLLDLKVADWIIEAKTPGGRSTGPSTSWQKVSLNNLIDMASGFYNDSTYGVDEGSLAQNINFFYSYTYEQKINFALNGFNDQTSTTFPGTLFVYHSTDFFLAARMLEVIIKKVTLFNGLQDYYDSLCLALQLSPAYCKMRVTNDTVAQPIGTYGMFGYIDDIGKLARFWAYSTTGSINGIPIVDKTYFKKAMQMTTYGLHTNRYADPASTCYPSNFQLVNAEKYGLGFWSSKNLNITQYPITTPNCNIKTVFASGYGGLSIGWAAQSWAYFQLDDNYDFKIFRPVQTLDNLIGCAKGLATIK